VVTMKLVKQKSGKAPKKGAGGVVKKKGGDNSQTKYTPFGGKGTEPNARRIAKRTNPHPHLERKKEGEPTKKKVVHGLLGAKQRKPQSETWWGAQNPL